MCDGNGEVTYLLGDMDLFRLEEERANLTYTCEEWKKMVCHDPAGTIGMKPPEVRIHFNKIMFQIVLCMHISVSYTLYLM